MKHCQKQHWGKKPLQLSCFSSQRMNVMFCIWCIYQVNLSTFSRSETTTGAVFHSQQSRYASSTWNHSTHYSCRLYVSSYETGLNECVFESVCVHDDHLNTFWALEPKTTKMWSYLPPAGPCYLSVNSERELDCVQVCMLLYDCVT